MPALSVLVLNCGSSTIKFELLAVGDAAGATAPPVERLARGAVERLGERATLVFARAGQAPERGQAEIPDHRAGVAWAVDRLRADAGAPIDAVGHRVVHGGARFVEPAPVDDALLAALEDLERRAPLHNGPSVAGIRACRERVGPALPMVAVFDTAFHATLPERAWRYAIPWELTERHGIRRFGFHGTSCRSVLDRYCELTDTAPARATVIVLHLGNGASATAIAGGRSVDTSMGLTPLEGLVMGTRAGDLDPAIVAHLARHEGVSCDEVERWLNERSGLLGVAGGSRDMRDLLGRAPTDPRAAVAVELFCYRARKYVGAYLAALGGADAVLFTGGIGERAPAVRARILDGLEWCGLEVDAARNDAATGVEGLISPDRARIAAWVIPTDEALVIARDTAACLRAAG